MEEHVHLEGDQVELRPITLEDVSDTYIGWLNDPDVTKFNSHGAALYTREKAIEYVAKVSASDEYRVFAIRARDTGAHIGNISLQRINQIDRSAEFAILVGDKTYWGKGVAKEASRLILRYGFEQLGLSRIYCGTSRANEPMQRLALALGFKEEGVRKDAMQKNGVLVDVIDYELLAADFTG